MIETVFKQPYCNNLYRPPHQTQQQMSNRIINKAFNSLAFRSKRAYYASQQQAQQQQQQQQTVETKTKVYGAVLCVKDTTTNETLYAVVQGRYTRKWSFPKGHLDTDETGIECTLREVAEETGIDELPEPIKFVKLGYGFYYVFELAEQVPLIPRDKREIINTKWVSLDEMMTLNVNIDINQFIKEQNN